MVNSSCLRSISISAFIRDVIRTEIDKRADEIKTFNKIEATKRERQEKIYKKCAGNDGVTDPNLGNTTIRAELAQDFINNLDNITNELNKFLWIKIDKMIEWIR